MHFRVVMKISPIILSMLISILVLSLLALYETGPLTGCSMGIMKLPFILGIVPPVTGVVSLPTFFALSMCDKYGIRNKLAQTFVALLIHLPLSFTIAALVTPIEGGMMWRCVLS